jgi:hypothetical protein
VSGSHGQPEPPRDGRFSLEDTIYELPPVDRSPIGAPAQVIRLASAPDCTVWTDRTDARLKALETAVREMGEAIGRLVLRLEGRE